MRTFGSVAVLVAAVLAVAACAAEESTNPPASDLFLPVGDADAGRQAFIDLRCYSCHVVQGDEEMPATTSANLGPEIGAPQAGDSRDYIAESILSPSHELPPLEQGPLSHMGDFREVMTVQQLIDIVTFVHQTGSGER